MSYLNPTEMEFAGMLAQLTPADATKEQMEQVGQVLQAYLQKSMALDVVARKYVETKAKLEDLQRSVGSALATSLKVQTSGSPAPVAKKPATLVPPRLSVVRPEGA